MEDKLVIGISSSALFDQAEADRVFRDKGLDSYRKYNRKRESVRLGPGTGFPLVQALLALNSRAKKQLVLVILISRNDADSGFRIMNSIKAWNLPIAEAAFTDGRPPSDYLEAYDCELFLSANRDDVVAALQAGFPAAMVYSPPDKREMDSKEVRIAFDGDAVLFGSESDQIFEKEGLAAFRTYEALLGAVPLNPGPLKGFLEGLARIQKEFPDETNCPIRTALVTARGLDAAKRPIRTLRAWGIRLDESFFLAGRSKVDILKKLRPHIFFDDLPANLKPAQKDVPAAEVLRTPLPRRARHKKKPKKRDHR